MRTVHRRIPQRRAPRAAFTLMEVLLVLAILGVIMALVLPNLLGQQEKANKQAARVTIQGIEDACKYYVIDHNGVYPTSLEALVVNPGSDPKWSGPYLEKVSGPPLDPWGSPIQYAYPGSNHGTADRPDIWSMGKDRQSNTGDDIGNWMTTQ